MASERLPWLLGAGAALLAGLLLRLWFLHYAPVLSGDAVIYTTIARNLLLHHVYGFNQHTGPAGHLVYEPTLIRLPGYPLFLALVFRLFGIDNIRAVLYIQIAAGLLTCLLAAALVRRLFGRATALAVLFLGALCPFTANYAAVPLTEPLVLLTIALVFYGLFRWMERSGGFNPWLWITAAALAASVLLRPEQGLLAAAILPAMLCFQLRGRPAPSSHSTTSNLRAAIPILVCAFLVVLPLVPWTLRNWRTFHVFQPLAPRSATDPGEPPTPGFNHWYGTWGLDFTTTDTVYWNIDGDPILPSDLPNRAFALGCTAPAGVPRTQLPLYAETTALLADYNRTTRDPPALDARFEHLARQRATAEPLCNHLLLPLGRLANMLLRPRVEILPIADEWWDPATPLRNRLFALAYAALNLAYLVLGLWGLLRWLRTLRHEGPGAPSNLPGAPFRAQPHRALNGLVGFRALPQPATLLLLSTVAMVALRLALLLTLDNSEPRYTLELFPVLFLWSAAALIRPISPPPSH